jgi:hypothetical protein
MLGLSVEDFKIHFMLDYSRRVALVVTPLWKFLIYHGDFDMVCNCTGGLHAVESMKTPSESLDLGTPWCR